MRPDALSRAFAAALHSDGPAGDGLPRAAGLVGVEHEYRVLRGGAHIDFRRLIDGLEMGRPHLDPADINARRLPSGAAVTCDGEEAEIALPPIATDAGFTVDAAARAATERRDLLARLPAGDELVGTSTHLSVGIDAEVRVIDAVARLYSRTFAPSLMLLLDRADSYGVYIRPRPGRLEFCGEFATGARLAAAIAFAAGSVAACLSTLVDPTPPPTLPPALRLRVDPCRDRFGYLVHRRSIRGDLYAEGRAAALPLMGGGSVPAQLHLAAAWGCARRWLVPADRGAADSLVSGIGALPVIADGDDAHLVRPAPRTTFGRLAQPFQRPGFAMATVMLTWEAAVLVAAQPGGRWAFACVPRPALDRFVEEADHGGLDDIVCAYLQALPRGRHLFAFTQAHQAGLYDSLGRRRGLLAKEPDEWSVTRVAA